MSAAWSGIDVPDSNFWSLLGMSVLHREKGKAEILLPVSDKLLQLFGVVHGGAIASLIDSVIGLAVNGFLDHGLQAATVEMNVNYLLPVTKGRLIAAATILQQGKRIIVGSAEVRDDKDRLVACGRATYIINRASGSIERAGGRQGPPTGRPGV
ncbi:MAG TPA: PaaI family thioesterase [Spirochaetia bacterium]|nr:PaaI family thioesterase [Spirochaetia bacterium]